MTPRTQLSVAGFLVTAVTFGPARMGFGLFLPRFREEFGLSSGLAGAIASGAFAAFLFAILLAGFLTWRIGPRAPVVAGTLAAAAGMALAAVAPGDAVLAAGVVLAGTSAGLSWSPFNSAATQHLAASDRPAVLSAVSTGTTVGVALAAALALAAGVLGFSWRLAWGLFAAAAVISTGVAFRILGGTAEAGGGTAAGQGLSGILDRSLIWPLAAACSFGATASIFVSFAADWVVRSGALAGTPSSAAAPLVFICYGVCGLVGLLSGALERRVGLGLFLGVLFLCSAASHALIGLLPRSLPAVALAAGLQGACVMTISAVLSFWTARLYPRMPSTGFTAALLSMALGGVVGAALAGAAMDGAGAPAVFLAAASCSFVTAAGILAGRRRMAVAAP